MRPNSSHLDLAPSLARVARGDLCAGCGGCAAIAPDAIKMAESADGFLRPVQQGQVSSAQDTQIAAICPGLTQTVLVDDRKDHPLWGPFLTMQTGHATDADLRFAGASGGGLSALAAWLLGTGKVDAILQIKADPDNPVGNVAVLSRTRAEVQAAAGSRYAPAAPLAVIPDLPEDAQRIAFIGKPCDCAALRALCDHDPQLAARFPVILSFFCAGTPSLQGAAAVLAALDTDLAQAQAFRYRGNGWPGAATVTRTNGETAQMSYHESWGRILSRHVQHRCKICADGTGTAADIVCADAWESDEEGYPLFEEGEGTSLFVARTASGAALLGEAEGAGALTLNLFSVPNLAAIQPGQTKRRRVLLARLLALRLLGKPTPTYRGLSLRAAAKGAPFRLLVRNFLGTLRRGLFPKGRS